MLKKYVFDVWAHNFANMSMFLRLKHAKKDWKEGKPLFDGNIGTKQVCHLAWYKSEAVKQKLLAIKNLLKFERLNLFGYWNT